MPPAWPIRRNAYGASLSAQGMWVVMVECAAAVMASLSGLGYAGLTPPYKRLGWASLFWRASPMP